MLSHFTIFTNNRTIKSMHKATQSQQPNIISRIFFNHIIIYNLFSYYTFDCRTHICLHFFVIDCFVFFSSFLSFNNVQVAGSERLSGRANCQSHIQFALIQQQYNGGESGAITASTRSKYTGSRELVLHTGKNCIYIIKKNKK